MKDTEFLLVGSLMMSHTCLRGSHVPDDVTHLSQVVSEQQPGVPARLTLDVLSLAKLRGLDVPPTDDSLKYEYGVEKRRYGGLPPAQVTELSLVLVHPWSNPALSSSVPRMPSDGLGLV